MLVFSRKIRQAIVMPAKKITITVLGNKRGRVLLGIDAPRGITVRRAEAAGGALTPAADASSNRGE